MSDQNQTATKRGLWVTHEGNPFCLYEPFPKQIIFHESSVTNLLAIGSRGSGKSRMLRADAHMRCLSIPGATCILIRKTMKQLEQSHLLDIGQEMELLGGHYHGTKHCAYYPNGSRLFFSYVGHSGDALNLLSAEFIAAYYDELSVIPWEYFIKLNASVRVSGDFRDKGLKAVVRGATNPLGESAAECIKYFVNKDVGYDEDEFLPDEWDHVRIDMEDNPYLDVDQYRKRFANAPEHIKKAWLYGEYADEHALFTFNRRREGQPYHVITSMPLEGDKPVIGYDWYSS